MPTPTITLLANTDLERVQTTWWRAVAQAWPAEAPPPALQLLPREDAERDPGLIAGDACAAWFERTPARQDLARLADAMHHRGAPALFVFPEVGAAECAINSDGVIAVARTESPSTMAAMLRALSQRQGAVESLLRELAVVRRCQAGMRGEMDRVHEELQLAAQVQRDFLPTSLPTFDGTDFGVLCRPAGYVSGDIYDVVRLDDRHAGFFIADAIGHGVPAALMTMVIARALPMVDRDGRATRVVPPGEALTRLNAELIRRQGESPRFASAVYGVLDTRTRRVRIASAGHPYPLLFGAEGRSTVRTEGGLLGVFPEEVYQEVEIEIGEGDTLVLHSDGFETAFPEPGADPYGRRMPTTHYVAHFDALAKQARDGLTLGQAMQVLARSLDAQTGSLHQVDDITVLAVRAVSHRRAEDLVPAPGRSAVGSGG